MARLARIASVATLLFAAAALAACGDDNTDKNRYVRQLTAAQTRFQTTQERLESDATQSSSASQNRRALSRFAASIADTITALREIDVPPEVVAEHRRFVGVFMAWHDDVTRFVRAIKNPTRSGFQRARRRIAAATTMFNQSSRQAATEIDAKLESS
ncbi:MAG: hypothetical protein WKF42_00455 [Solirubrobacteraceae bacterium]